jgi:hypothetical protein
MVNYQPQLEGINRQRDFTQGIMAQALAPQQNQNALTGIARILSAYLANKNMGALNKQEQDLTNQQGMARRNEMSRILGMTQDQPAHTLPPGQVGPSAPARQGVPLAQALMGSEIPEFQNMGMEAALKVGNDSTPSNVQEWNYYNTLNPEQQSQYLNMKRSGFGAGGVQYTAGGQQIIPTDKVAQDKAAIAAAEAAAKAQAENAVDKSGKAPVLDSMKYVMGQYRELLPKVNTGGPMGAVGKASRVFDSQDVMRFENLNQQLSTDLRTVFRIPGEGPLSNQEQQQYGLQLPSVNYDQATNEAIMNDLEVRAGLRSGQSAPQAGSPQIGTVEDGYEFIGGDPKDPKSWRLVSQ